MRTTRLCIAVSRLFHEIFWQFVSMKTYLPLQSKYVKAHLYFLYRYCFDLRCTLPCECNKEMPCILTICPFCIVFVNELCTLVKPKLCATLDQLPAVNNACSSGSYIMRSREWQRRRFAMTEGDVEVPSSSNAGQDILDLSTADINDDSI